MKLSCRPAILCHEPRKERVIRTKVCLAGEASQEYTQENVIQGSWYADVHDDEQGGISGMLLPR